MPQVIIVPESDEYQLDVSHNGVVWINKNLGRPQLDTREARYLGPLWLDIGGVNRLYHIVGVEEKSGAWELELGNSFVLPDVWQRAGQHRRFEYADLSDFDMVEVREGLLIPVS